MLSLMFVLYENKEPAHVFVWRLGGTFFQILEIEVGNDDDSTMMSTILT